MSFAFGQLATLFEYKMEQRRYAKFRKEHLQKVEQNFQQMTDESHELQKLFIECGDKVTLQNSGK